MKRIAVLLGLLALTACSALEPVGPSRLCADRYVSALTGHEAKGTFACLNPEVTAAWRTVEVTKDSDFAEVSSLLDLTSASYVGRSGAGAYVYDIHGKDNHERHIFVVTLDKAGKVSDNRALDYLQR